MNFMLGIVERCRRDNGKAKRGPQRASGLPTEMGRMNASLRTSWLRWCFSNLVAHCSHLGVLKTPDACVPGI